jgi:multiple sugar transport system permease protein
VFSRITRAHGADTAKKIARFLILTGLGCVFVYPLLYMISVSFMDTKDLVDSTVSWIPTHLSFESFIKAAKTLSFWKGFRDSLKMTVIPAALQTFVLAAAGYGLARYRVPLKKLWIALSVVIFLIPVQVTMIPRFLLFNSYNAGGNDLAMYLIYALRPGGQELGVPADLLQLLWLYSKSIDEAARIDGRCR